MAEWHEQLSDDYRGNETLAGIPDIDTLAKSYIDAQKHIGGSIRVPSDDAGQEDWAAFNAKLTEKVPTLINLPSDATEANAALYARLGRPETAEGYATEGLTAEEKQWAFDNGFTDSQIKALAEHTNKTNDAATTAATESAKAAFDGLKQEWGLAYDQKLAEANQAINAYADEAAVEFITSQGLNENADFIKMMASIGSQLGEEPAGNINNNSNFALSPEEAQIHIAEINANREHPYHTGNKDAIAKMQRLFAQAYPE